MESKCTSSMYSSRRESHRGSPHCECKHCILHKSRRYVGRAETASLPCGGGGGRGQDLRRWKGVTGEVWFMYLLWYAFLCWQGRLQ